MNNLPNDIIQYIGSFTNFNNYVYINKNFHLISKYDYFKLVIKQNISKILFTKQHIIKYNDIYYNNDYSFEGMINGIYKILSTNSRNHLFIRLDLVKYSDFFLSNLEPALLHVDNNLIPGKILFECF
jgi:hypothetical protein